MSGKKKKCDTDKSEGVKDEDILRGQCKQIEDKIMEMKEKKLGRVGNIFKIKESINGSKKGSQDPPAVRHPVTDDIVVSNEKIKRVILDYCVQNLTDNVAYPDVEKDIETKRLLHRMRMEVMMKD